MSPPRNIGTEYRDAVTWAQDLLGTSRPVAEAVLYSALQESRLVESAGGYLLLEDDEEVERRRQGVMQQDQKFTKGWNKIHFRHAMNTKRNASRRMSTQAVEKKAASAQAPAAHDMIRVQAQRAALRDDDEGGR